MSDDYEPIDLSGFSDPAADEPTGPDEPILLRGVPFRLRPVTLGDGGHSYPARVLINRHAFTVIVAHRLLDSDVKDGDVGRQATVAVYEIRVGGRDVSLAIRERHEIGYASATVRTQSGELIPYWMLQPFRAVSDQQPGIAADLRGTSAAYDLNAAAHHPPARYFLLAWRNPWPDAEIESLTVKPAGIPFVIGGLTVGHLDEWPFILDAGHEVRISPKTPHSLAGNELWVHVDRGVA